MYETLETERLKLRKFAEADLDDYARMSADPEMMRYIGAGVVLKRPEAWRSLAMLLGHWQLRGYGMWAVEEKATGAFIGRLGLHFPEGWPGIEVGWLIDRSRWGQGLATEGGRAAMAFAFERLGLARLCSLIHPQNVASIRVAEKLGMSPERPIQIFGVDVVMYSRTAEGFPQ